MSSSITPFYRPGSFPALSARLLASASQSLRQAINSQILLKSFYSTPLRVGGLPVTTTKGFTYLIAASWHPKRKRQKVPVVNSISENLWWKERMRPGKVDAGEDAFFYVGTNNGVALGVADGMGVDPANFSWALMESSASVAKEFSSSEIALFSAPNGFADILDSKKILTGAFENLIKSGKVNAGSSTACILSLSKSSGILNASSLGDSAYLLIRNGELIYESPAQQHFFNCPYQLTIVPEHFPNQKLYFKDKPSDAYQASHQLQDGDVILLATDGFFDNVFSYEAVAIVNKELRNVINRDRTFYDSGNLDELRTHVKKLSRQLTDTARRFSLDSRRVSPFSQSAKKSGENRIGGELREFL
ncbi:22479_t:CDS:2 [Entrophospora sp. SA101]|nr:14510_t:CDS:2 [Entrophospora candida]CAH1764660.1 940_t:CDS:2 [Entrophospora sp. SA101]CAG8602969.1 1509_t:CDS:2 [Entrophospora candida]CAJ0640543.1 15215_t:CDS:2 [Entrophospora sp. SA101]CAJ0642205.1 3039_t:CDS:2 [Entrophospora sp. SA101]